MFESFLRKKKKLDKIKKGKTIKKVFRILKWTFVFLTLLLLIIISVLWYLLNDYAYADLEQEKESVLKYYSPSLARDSLTLDSLHFFDFDFREFRNPAPEYGPYARWWWPGNDVEKDELKREIGLFADAGFAGVEIQAFGTGLNPEAPESRIKRIQTYGEPAFYDNLSVVMRVAAKRGLTIDLNAGSGFPLGGTQNALGDNFTTLLYSEATFEGGGTIHWDPPLPKAPLTSYLSYFGTKFTSGFISGGRMHLEKAELIEVVAAKLVKNGRSPWVHRISDQVELDHNSLYTLMGNVQKGVLNWDAPEGKWHLIAIWSLPAGEVPALTDRIVDERGWVVDHFDTTRILANYNYLFGERSGLSTFYGNPLRAVFNDSYEFKVERFYPRDMLKEFKERRGYDLEPYLPVIFSPGKDHLIGHIALKAAMPDFVITEEDWRIRYDYDQTVSDLFTERFIKKSHEWLNARGMKHRTQPYGMAQLDVIKGAAASGIPEVESLFAEGANAMMKYVTSGAMLSNRPIVTIETLGGVNTSYMTTPKKIKLFADKAFTAGVNQLIYHGIPYRYKNEDFTKEGWHPFDSPYFFPSFSSALNEENVFWDYMPKINEYMRRCQYVLQSGLPTSQVLVYTYHPQIEITQNLSNPKEILKSGVFSEDEPFGGEVGIPFLDKSEIDPFSEWLQDVYGITDKFDSSGIGWNWVNSSLLEEATIGDGSFAINDNHYTKIVVPSAEYMPVASALKLKMLADAGVQVMFTGSLPDKQPSFKDFGAQDEKLQITVDAILNTEYGRHLDKSQAIEDWIGSIAPDLPYEDKSSYLMHIQRVQSDGSQIFFIRNRSNEGKSFRLEHLNGFEYLYSMDPNTGRIGQAFPRAEIDIDGYGSIFLWMRNAPIPEEWLSIPNSNIEPGRVVQTLEKWNIKIANGDYSDSTLFDWTTKEDTKHTLEGKYTTTFRMADIESDKLYYLDLGTVKHVANVTLNDTTLPPLIFPPYTVNIAPYLKEGNNILEIRVITAQSNQFLGKALSGEDLYGKYKKRPLMPSGLLGPVHIMVQNNSAVEPSSSGLE